jgi:hypothetical protein
MGPLGPLAGFTEPAEGDDRIPMWIPYVRVDDVEAAAERWHALMRRVAPWNGTNLECGERSSTP